MSSRNNFLFSTAADELVARQCRRTEAGHRVRGQILDVGRRHRELGRQRAEQHAGPSARRGRGARHQRCFRSPRGANGRFRAENRDHFLDAVEWQVEIIISFYFIILE